MNIGFDRCHRNGTINHITIGVFDAIGKIDAGWIGRRHVVVRPVESQEEALCGGVFDMDIKPALWVGVVKGGKAVIAGVVDMQGCEVRGGIAVDIDDAIGGYFAGTFCE